MERIYQMNVVPDVLPALKPTIDLHVIARTTPKEFLNSKKVQEVVEPGVFLKSKQVSICLLRSVPKRFNIIEIDNHTPETACQCLPYRCPVIYNASR